MKGSKPESPDTIIWIGNSPSYLNTSDKAQFSPKWHPSYVATKSSHTSETSLPTPSTYESSYSLWKEAQPYFNGTPYGRGKTYFNPKDGSAPNTDDELLALAFKGSDKPRLEYVLSNGVIILIRAIQGQSGDTKDLDVRSMRRAKVKATDGSDYSVPGQRFRNLLWHGTSIKASQAIQQCGKIIPGIRVQRYGRSEIYASGGLQGVHPDNATQDFNNLDRWYDPKADQDNLPILPGVYKFNNHKVSHVLGIDLKKSIADGNEWVQFASKAYSTRQDINLSSVALILRVPQRPYDSYEIEWINPEFQIRLQKLQQR
jgi:hypothetical protein